MTDYPPVCVCVWAEETEAEITLGTDLRMFPSALTCPAGPPCDLRVLPLLSLEVQQLPSAPPHFSLRADTSLSSLSRRSRKAEKSASQPPQEPDPDGSSLILWVRTRGAPGARSISLPVEQHRVTAERNLPGAASQAGSAGVCFYLLGSRRPERRSPLRSPPAGGDNVLIYTGPDVLTNTAKYSTVNPEHTEAKGEGVPGGFD